MKRALVITLVLMAVITIQPIGFAAAQDTGPEAPEGDLPDDAAGGEPLDGDLAPAEEDDAAATATPAPANLPAGGGPNTAAIVAGLGDSNFWLTLLVTVVCGALGGLVYELIILQGNIELPHKSTAAESLPASDSPLAIQLYLYDLGIWGRILIGGLAAVGVAWLLEPENLTALVSLSLIAGSAGISVFKSMQDRLTAALAVQKVVETQKQLDDTLARGEEVTAELETKIETLKQDLETQAGSEPGEPVLKLEDVQLPQAQLDEIQKLVVRAKGIYSK